MNSAGVVNAIKKYGLIIGPDFQPGCKPEIVGWSVYLNWMDASSDTKSFDWMANKRAIASAPHLSLAVHEAVKKIKAARTEKHKKR